mgnify:CR=1 FL=1
MGEGEMRAKIFYVLGFGLSDETQCRNRKEGVGEETKLRQAKGAVQKGIKQYFLQLFPSVPRR